MWFQNRRAKWRKKENTKKGPGRPAHNAQPQTCSGVPIPPDELEKRERERRDKKLRKQLERQAKKLGKSGRKVDVESLLLSAKMALNENMQNHGHHGMDGGRGDLLNDKPIGGIGHDVGGETYIDVVGEADDGGRSVESDDHDDGMTSREKLSGVIKRSSFTIASILSSSRDDGDVTSGAKSGSSPHHPRQLSILNELLDSCDDEPDEEDHNNNCNSNMADDEDDVTDYTMTSCAV